MARWLFKEEPTHYAFVDLVREGKTSWNGVHNPLALRHLRATRRGDEVLYYHSGDARAVVGIARVTRGPIADDSDGRPSVTVEIAPVRALRRAVPMTELKGDSRLDGFVLFRIGRLSVMPVSDAEWVAILVHETTPDPPSARRTPLRRPAAQRRSGGAPRTAKRERGSVTAPRGRARRPVHGTGG